MYMNDWLSEWWIRFILGAAGSSLIAALAYRFRSLSRSGMWSAIIMGTSYVTLGGPLWFGVLLAFFLSSTGWSKWKRHHRKKQQAESSYAKSGRRDAWQVWANGGLGLLLCAGHAVWPSAGWVFAFVGVMGAVNADTWATEIGALSRSAPRALLSGKPVTPGTSGGVTVLGSAAALAGAAFIGVLQRCLRRKQRHRLACSSQPQLWRASSAPSPTRCLARPRKRCTAAASAAAIRSAPSTAAALPSKYAASPG